MFDFLDADSALADVFRAVALFIPRLLVFGAMLLVGWLIARLARRLCVAVLTRVGFPRMVERSGLNRFLARGPAAADTPDAHTARADLDATTLIGRLVYCAMLLVTAQMAFGVWGPNPVSDLITDVLAWIPRADEGRIAEGFVGGGEGRARPGRGKGRRRTERFGTEQIQLVRTALAMASPLLNSGPWPFRFVGR